MKIRDIINKVYKSKQFEDGVSLYDLASSEFNLDIDYCGDQNRLMSYFIGNWYCTDSYVGYKVYFFDDEPVAVSSQTGRKMNEDIEWISAESYNKVRDYILTFFEHKVPNISLCDLDEELGDSYKIEYHSQLFDYHKTIAKYEGDSVQIIEFHKGTGFNELEQYQPSLVKIKMPDKSEKWLEVKELDFPYNTINS